jgi:copper(I)-binding protein
MSGLVKLFLGTILAVSPVMAQDSAPAAASALQIQDAYARAVPPGQHNSAAFLRIHNSSDQKRALMSAASPVAEVVELHTHTKDQGVMRMRRIERIEIPAQGTAVLQPGGLHLMLIGLKQPLAADDPLTLRLVFDEDEVIEVNATARAVMPGHGQRQD